MRYLLDTSTLLEALRKKPASHFVTRVKRIGSEARFASAVSVAELLAAAHPKRDLKLAQDVVKLVASVKVLSFGRPAAQAYGKIQSELAEPLKTEDAMVAATAIAEGLILVTRRIATFSSIPGITVEDWTMPPTLALVSSEEEIEAELVEG